MKSVLRGIGIFMLVLSVVFLGISFDNVAVRVKKPADLYADDYSVEEIAKILKISKSAVKMRLKRSRELLKIQLEDYDNEQK